MGAGRPGRLASWGWGHVLPLLHILSTLHPQLHRGHNASDKLTLRRVCSRRAPARARARALPTPARALRALRPLAGARGRASRASRGGGGGAAHAHGPAARAERGAPRGCRHDGRGCVRSRQSRGRLRPPHTGPAAAHHPARRVLGKDGLVAGPGRGWGAGKGGEPEWTPTARDPRQGRGSPRGAVLRSSASRPSLPSFWAPGAGVRRLRGAPAVAPEALAFRRPQFVRSPPSL